MPFDDIVSVRQELARLAAGKPKAVRLAVANLDRWLEVLTEPPETHAGIDAEACALKAVEAVERAIGR